MQISRVLAIETSCDDTSVALVKSDGFVEVCLSANQDLAHQPFGGVVPEIASRNHTLNLLPLVEEALQRSQIDWEQIDALVVTSRPGLVGSLLVGVVTAKTLALGKSIPFLGVNHLEGHILAPFLKDERHQPPPAFTYPYLALAISGGHTQIYRVKELGAYQIMGQTIDDAAGEAFDKFAKMLGLGFPGGVKVDQLAQKGNPKAFPFPRPLINEDNYQFSFSGLKTAALRFVESHDKEFIETHLNDICASYQEAIVDVLLHKLNRAVEKSGIRQVTLTGGVSANSRLRNRAEEWARSKNLTLAIPPLRYCTDNAAMIGYAGILRLNRGERSDHSLGPSPQVLAGDFQPLDAL